MRSFDNNSEVGLCCRLLCLNWTGSASFLFPRKTNLQLAKQQHFEAVLKDIFLCETVQEENEFPVWEGPPCEEDLETQVGDYSHREHYGDGLPGGFDAPDWIDTLLRGGNTDSDTEYNIYTEGNCCWRGGVIIGYSSDGDFS